MATKVYTTKDLAAVARRNHPGTLAVLRSLDVRPLRTIRTARNTRYEWGQSAMDALVAWRAERDTPEAPREGDHVDTRDGVPDGVLLVTEDCVRQLQQQVAALSAQVAALTAISNGILEEVTRPSR